MMRMNGATCGDWHFHERGGDIMGMEYILLLLYLTKQGNVSSVTVSENSVTIRIKK